mmetsp:Transcript_108588/g.306134  ORF Transcript_108588/g.306134 Transcript_108588/m.306134 type:complete len:546 (-) Transcript_108588:48-1685(-)
MCGRSLRRRSIGRVEMTPLVGLAIISGLLDTGLAWRVEQNWWRRNLATEGCSAVDHGAALSLVQFSASAVTVGVGLDPQVLRSHEASLAHNRSLEGVTPEPVKAAERSARKVNATAWNEFFSRAAVATATSTKYGAATFGFLLVLVLILCFMGAFIVLDIVTGTEDKASSRTRLARLRAIPVRSAVLAQEQNVRQSAMQPLRADRERQEIPVSVGEPRRASRHPAQQAQTPKGSFMNVVSSRTTMHSQRGASHITLANTAGFAIGDRIIVDMAEIRTVTAMDGPSIALNARLQQEYPIGTEVRQVVESRPGSLERMSLGAAVTPPRLSMPMSPVVAESVTSYETSAVPVLQSTPPPICRELVMPHCDAMFAISFSDLEHPSTSFDLYGLSGKPLLRGVMESEPSTGRGTISISMPPRKSTSLGMIVSSGRDEQSMELVGKNKVTYGELRNTGVLSYSLIHRGQAVARLFLDLQTKKLTMTSELDGACMASAAKCLESGFFQDVEHLEVRVNPGVDAVLVLLSVLGVVVFGAQNGQGIPEGTQHMS